jgi:Ser/Thr protein kinase RdoA (MazF antagonist)
VHFTSPRVRAGIALSGPTVSEPRGPEEGPSFDALTPEVVLTSLEDSHGVRLDGTLQYYSSYVNRVYGVRTDTGTEYVAKFYRPGRWSVDAIADEHEFILDCAAAELPVVPPLPDPDGFTLQLLEVEGPTGARDYPYAVYEKRGGRGFDAERDEEWLRLGALAGRVHAVGAMGRSPHRLTCTPQASTRRFADELRAAGVVHPEIDDEFFTLVEQGIGLIDPLFDGIEHQRIHGDFHRGNVLDRGDDGLLLIDFDDTMMGPPVQDLWLLLPDHAWAARRELNLVIEGYEQFRELDQRSLRLIEPLRLMRMIYYLAWSALQRDDHRFLQANPGWGTRAFWIREVEDLRVQLDAIVEDQG